MVYYKKHVSCRAHVSTYIVVYLSIALLTLALLVLRAQLYAHRIKS